MTLGGPDHPAALPRVRAAIERLHTRGASLALDCAQLCEVDGDTVDEERSRIEMDIDEAAVATLLREGGRFRRRVRRGG